MKKQSSSSTSKPPPPNPGGRPPGAETPGQIAKRELKAAVAHNARIRGNVSKLMDMLMEQVKESPERAATALETIGNLLASSSKGLEGILKAAQKDDAGPGAGGTDWEKML